MNIERRIKSVGSHCVQISAENGFENFLVLFHHYTTVNVDKRRVLTLHLTIFHELMAEYLTENHLAYKCVVKITTKKFKGTTYKITEQKLKKKRKKKNKKH